MPEFDLPMRQRRAGDALTLTLSRREREPSFPLWLQFSTRKLIDRIPSDRGILVPHTSAEQPENQLGSVRHL